MACIGDAKRNLERVKTVSEVGPGSYNIEPNHNPKASYAPFFSMQPKFHNKKQKQAQEKIGPGSYDISRQIGNPSFVRIENDHSIIIKINDFGSSVFRSAQPRFNEGKPEPTPGPGQYLGPHSRSMSSHSNVKKRQQNRSSDHPIIKNLRQMNSSYERAHELKSLAQPPPQAPKNSIGPGYYNANKGTFEQTNYRGVRWDLSQQQRFKTEQKQIMTAEHQQLMTEEIRRERQKQKNNLPSAFFRSDTIKSYFDQIVYGTQSSIKADIRKKLGYRSPEPAPGSYIKVYQQQKPHNKYQFFGSTQERFKTEAQGEVGPGEYAVQHGFMHKPKRKNRIDKTKRAPLQKTQQIPGPGAYNITDVTSSKPSTNIEQFGSLVARFIQPSTAEPTKPQLDEMIYQLQQKLQKREKPVQLCSPMFRSSTDRDCFSYQKEKTKIPFGEYKVEQDDIGQKVKKKKSYLNHLAYCMLKRPAFDSSTDRFTELKKQKQPLNISLDRTRTPYETYERVSHSSVFQSKEKRKLFQGKRNAPPVGLYDQSIPGKKSFNKRYRSSSDNNPSIVSSRVVGRT